MTGLYLIEKSCQRSKLEVNLDLIVFWPLPSLEMFFLPIKALYLSLSTVCVVYTYGQCFYPDCLLDQSGHGVLHPV